MTQEEKAKRYDEAIKKFRPIYDLAKEQNCTIDVEEFESIFPELKESEDGKIRKALIDFFSKGAENGEQTNGVCDKDILTWLKKQGEQKLVDKYNIRSIGSKNAQGKLGEMIKEMKSADKVEPKFHEGDWLVNIEYGNVVRVLEVLKDNYRLDFGVDTIGTLCTELVDNDYRLWDITKDAKDGDVLAAESRNGYPSHFIAIYKEHGLNFFNSHCFISLDGEFNKGTTGHSIYLICPATKEQRDVLFAKMKEAGYEWDAEKKELKKIENKRPMLSDFFKAEYERGKADAQKPTNKTEPRFKVGQTIKKEGFNLGFTIVKIEDGFYYNDMGDHFPFTAQDEWELVEQKPSEWSEEDENIEYSIIEVLTKQGFQTQVNWLKSLKDRVQPKQEWSEENKEMLNLIIARLHSHPNVDLEEYSKEYDWLNYNLKSLRPQSNITDKELAEAKKDAYNDALNKIEYHSGEPTFDDGWSAAIWYLKKRNAMPQNRWKPSEEQIATIEYIIKGYESTTIHLYDGAAKQLYKLLEQFKQL